jgi:carbonic anhydrase
LDQLPKNSTVIIDAGKTHYIHFDVLELIREFKNIKAPERNINCILTGFKEKYKIENTDNGFSESQTYRPVQGSESFQQSEAAFN